MNRLLRPRNWEPACGTERSAASANNMVVLPGVLGCRPLRRIPRSAGHTHLRGLATAIHEIAGLIVIAKLDEQFGSLVVIDY
jgi:hypothetical protein